jgi:hypothetical protein
LLPDEIRAPDEPWPPPEAAANSGDPSGPMTASGLPQRIPGGTWAAAEPGGSPPDAPGPANAAGTDGPPQDPDHDLAPPERPAP